MTRASLLLLLLAVTVDYFLFQQCLLSSSLFLHSLSQTNLKSTMWRRQGNSSRLSSLNDEERRNGNRKARRQSFSQSKKSTKRVVRFEVDSSSDEDKCVVSSSTVRQAQQRRSSFGAFVRRNRQGGPEYGANVQQKRQDEQQRETSQNNTSQVQLLQVAREIEQILIDDVHSQNVDQICIPEEGSESEGALHPEPLQDPADSEIIPSSTTAENYTETLARPPRRRSRLLRLGLSPREHARRLPSHSAPDPPGIRFLDEYHRNTSSTSQRRSNRLTEQDVNAYGLFESAGADEARLRLYERRTQRSHQTQEQQEPGTLASLFFSRTSILGTDPTVIYAGRSYGMNFLLALPHILLGIFGVLVLLKLLSLLVAGGIALMILIALCLLGYAWNQPLQTLRKIQENPVLIWTAMGALGGLLWDFSLRLRPLATFWKESMKNLPRGSCLDEGWSWTLDQCGVLHDIYAFSRTPIARDRQTLTVFYNAFFVEQDRSVTLLCVTFGIGVGCCVAGAWEVLFGTRDNPYVLYTRCLDRVRLITRNRRQREKEQAQAVWQREFNRKEKIGGTGDRRNSRRPHCSICLEEFPCNEDETSSLFHRHYLLCRHSFHHTCIQEWLEINSSCPICRIPLEDGGQTRLATTPNTT